MTSILQVNNLTKTFGKRTIIDQLSFSVETGTSLAITGASGCGKSTLLNMIGMLESPSSGQIFLEGKLLPKINSSAATKLRRHTINYLFQSYALISEQSTLDNALLALHYADLSKKEKLARIDHILERLGLDKVKHDKVVTLSGGEQQRLALARCILKPGNLILADEPTGALDQNLAVQVTKEILKLQQEHHKTIIIVTHDPNIAKQCDRILSLGETHIAS